jgi:O-antigen/teichoic acid export membrane protein
VRLPEPPVVDVPPLPPIVEALPQPPMVEVLERPTVIVLPEPPIVEMPEPPPSEGDNRRRRSRVGAYLDSWRGGTSLSRRASMTSFASALDTVAGLVVQFLINPLLVNGLGTFLYGAWRFLYSLNGYLWAVSGRSAQALTWVIAHGQRTMDDDEKRGYVASAIIVWFIFLPLLLVVGGFVAWFAPNLLHAPPEHVWEVRLAALLLGADAIALTLLSIPRSVLQGENLGYKRMGLSAALIVVNGFLMAAAIWLDTGLVGVAVANVLGTLTSGILFWRVAKRYVPWFGMRRPERAKLRSFVGLSAWFTAWKLVYEAMSAGDVVVLGIFGSAQLVTVYALTKFAAQSIVPIVGTLFEGTSPGLGAIIGAGEHGRARELRSELMAFSWIITAVIGASLLLWNRSFVGLWVRPDLYGGSLVTLLISIMAMQFVFIGNDARIIDLTLKVRGKVIAGAISATLSIVLAAALISLMDDPIVAMCIGVIVGRAVVSVAYPMQIGRLLDVSIWQQVRALPRPAAATIGLFSVAMWLGRGLVVHSWIRLILYGGLTSLALGVVAAFVGLNPPQRRALFRRLRKIVRGGGRSRATDGAAR